MGRLEPLRGLLACLRGELPERPNWSNIIALANRTLCSPMVAIRLLEAGRFPDLPEDLRIFLQEILTRNERRNRQLLKQLGEAAASLGEIGVRPVLLKGTAWLARANEQERGARMLADLDLIVPPAHFQAAIEQLGRLGYRLDAPVPRPNVPAVLSRPQDAATIDLHSEYGGATTLLCRFKDLARHGAPVALPGSTALLPSRIFQVAILLLHDQLKGRDYLRGRIDLRHLIDIHSLATGFDDRQWDELERLFTDGYARVAVRTQLLTARKLLGLEVPDRLVSGLRPRLQYRRRMIQARWPATALPLTLLSLLDPCYLDARRAWRNADVSTMEPTDNPQPAQFLPRRTSIMRLLLRRELGKV